MIRNTVRNTTYSKSAATAGVALPASVPPPDGEAWLQGFRSTQPVFQCVFGMLTVGSSSSAAGCVLVHLDTLPWWDQLAVKRCSRTDAADMLQVLLFGFHTFTPERQSWTVCTGLMCSAANEYISIVLIVAETVLSNQLTEEQLLKPDPSFTWWINQLVRRLWAWIRSRHSLLD